MISYKQGDVVYRGGGKQQAVYAIQDPTVAWEEVPEVLDVEDALQRGLEEVPALGEDGDPCSDDGRFGEGEVQELVGDEPDDEHRAQEAAQAALDCLVRAQAREEQVPAEEAAGEVSAGVGDPGPHHGDEDEDDAVARAREEAEVGQRGADPERHQEHCQNRLEGADLWLSREPEERPRETEKG